MKISIDTEQDTFPSAVKAVHAAYGVPYDATTIPVDVDSSAEEVEVDGEVVEEEDYFPGKWNRKRIRKLLSYITEDAEEALAYIARHAPAVDIDQVFEHMGNHTEIPNFNGKHMGGRMSSVGFAMKRIPGITADIVDTDYRYRKYRMDKGIAKVLLEELND